MKKYILSGIVLTTFAGYSLYLRLPNESDYVTPVLTTPAPAPTMMNNQNMGNGMGMMKTYKDGVYKGIVADAIYGPVQVQVTISGGKIVNVIFLQSPNDRQTSIEINQRAMPILKKEALAAQSAQVDIVTGASQTSRAFKESLSSALLQAK